MGIFDWLLPRASEEKQAIQYLGQVAFEIRPTGVVPPSGDVGDEVEAFLPRLDEARKRAARFRQNCMADAERQSVADSQPAGAASRHSKYNGSPATPAGDQEELNRTLGNPCHVETLD